jgi:2-amino-4-hydroxy-6-hydroxymethyldihydropteridine diphosphokinase
MKEIYLALGSNLGDRADNLARALAMLESSLGKAQKRSAIIETQPWGVSNQGNYLNQVLCFQTALSAESLLQLCQSIELKLGRERKGKWDARTIDIDILLYGEEVIHTENLQIPHALMHERAFVLEPLLSISTSLKDPVSGLLYSHYLERLKNL